jgi:aminoglycoside phosphotransferase family enzyme/predicted kinase
MALEGESPIAPGFTPAELLTPSAFAHPVTRLELRETNISWIILTGAFAYKIKKSVRLEFLDASTLALRRHLCEEELRLNRRLAADLYLDVTAITREAGVVRVGGHGQIIEYAVQMKQFEAAQELSALLDAGQVSGEEINEFAMRLAEFHASAARAASTQDFQHTEQLHDAVLGNLATLLAHLDGGSALPDLGLLIDWTHDSLHDLLPEFRARERCGYVRECHGDLHAGNIVRWNGRLVPFDCLEFNPKLRWIDVMNDVAFLVMDLSARGRKDLAWSFLNAYLERSGDYDGVRLLVFYAVYRALVRAMVDSLEAQGVPEHRERSLNRLRTRVTTAVDFVNRPPPRLFIMHGVSGSGKSWLSERLVAQLGAVRIRSDVERKRLAGARTSGVDEPGFEQGIYTPEFSHRTYARLLECARSCLKGGADTVIDAAFLKAADRRAFRELAVRQGVPFFIVSCEATERILTQRITKRRQLHLDPSEAGAEVLARQSQHLQPFDADEQLHLITIDTTQPDALQTTLRAIKKHLAPIKPDTRPVMPPGTI